MSDVTSIVSDSSSTPTPAEAAARITTLKADGTFTSKWLAGDADARQTMAQLHELAHPGHFNPSEGTMSSEPAAGEPTTAEQAQARIAALRRDAAWVSKWANGDAGARAEMDRLMQAAHPTDSAEAPIDAAAQPHEFEFPATMTDERGEPDTKAMQAVGQMLSTAGFDRATGSTLMRQGDRAETVTRSMTDAQFATYQEQQLATLKTLWKGDYDKNLDLTRQLVDELDARHNGAVRAALNAAPGAQCSANFIIGLFHAAQRLQARNNRKGE